MVTLMCLLPLRHRASLQSPSRLARQNSRQWTVQYVAGLLAYLMLFCPFAMASTNERINVVFILADDLGWGEVGCFGQQRIPTPNIDRLATEGMRFTQHYSGAPVCAPSRCVLMTGRHLGHAEIRGNQQAGVKFPEFSEGQHPLSEQAVTIAQKFQQAGYATGAMGKWGLGPVGSTGDPNRKGFDVFFGYNCQAVAHSYYPKSLWRNAEQVVINPRPISGHTQPVSGDVQIEDWVGEVYAPRRMVTEAEHFIALNAAKPFFLFLPFVEPHVAIHPPRSSVELFPAEWDQQPYRGECGYLPHPRPRAGYAAMIHELDSHVGHILDAIERAGVADRTLVVFTSDNGTTHEGRAGAKFHVGGVDADFFNSTAGLRGYKGSVYEGGIRVPMIARLPKRIHAGTVSETPGYFADWFPTLCAAAGLEPPTGLDGVSLWPVMTGEHSGVAARPPMVWVFSEYGGQVAVRDGQYKVVRRNLKASIPGPWEVYDLTADPRESHDISGSHPDLIAHAVEILKRETDENATFPVPIPGVNTPEKQGR